MALVYTLTEAFPDDKGGGQEKTKQDSIYSAIASMSFNADGDQIT
jgi:hypothetical protein